MLPPLSTRIAVFSLLHRTIRANVLAIDQVTGTLSRLLLLRTVDLDDVEGLARSNRASQVGRFGIQILSRDDLEPSGKQQSSLGLKL
jgi:hypothetical protein